MCGRSQRTTACACGGKGMPAWPLYSNPFPSLVKIFQDSGFKSFPSRVIAALCVVLPTSISISELVDSCKEGVEIIPTKLWFNIETKTTTFVCQTEPLLCNVQVTDCSRDTKNAWEHSDIWALWHFSLIEWIGKTGVFGQPVIFETLQIFEGVLIAMSGEKGGEGEKRQRSRHSRWGWWWIWYWWWTLKNMINCAVMVMSNNEFIINNMSENS